MERFRSLNRYQKGILLVMVLMIVIFSVIYPRTISRVGYFYRNAIFVPGDENGNTVYSGRLDGKQAQFVVSSGDTVTLACGDKTYGPYTVTEDPTAIPEDENAHEMTGIEIRNGEELFFRGGVLVLGTHYFYLYNEDGTIDYSDFSAYTTNGINLDNKGNVADPLEPSAYTIYELLNDPPLTHKGHPEAWFMAVLLCILNTVSILFADELFRFKLAFRVRDPEQVEPSDWEISARFIGWTLITLLALILFAWGLQY